MRRARDATTSRWWIAVSQWYGDAGHPQEPYPGPCFLIRDGDPLYGQTFQRRTANCGIRTIQIPGGRPQCSGYVEQLIRTFRQKCLRHFIILDEHHLTWVLQAYLACYHRSRPHQGLNQETPLPQPRLLCSDDIIRSRPILGASTTSTSAPPLERAVAPPT